jgi:lipid II:glycine glycyltransferase (peptidoglycan interpeptide bridge formation enzyme)
MLEVSVTKGGLDPEWDGFLESRPDGCYQQSSLWAKLKSAGGWKPLRLVAREHGAIVGGAQILLRPVKSFGAVGYISKGPVIAANDTEVHDFILDQLEHGARAEHILFLKMQPSFGAEDVAQCLLERGALPSKTTVIPQATAWVDIRPDAEAIMQLMPRKKRQDIRRAERRAVSVRDGTQADLPTFYRLVKIHSERQGYHPQSQGYYHSLWTIFSSEARACLLVAEKDSDALAAMMIILFGDVAYPLFVGDSGSHSELNAQSLLHWKAMLWGKERGCAWYDFGGIDVSIARAIMNGEPIEETRAGRITRFKMSFGSQVILRPSAYDMSFVWPRKLTSRMVPNLMRVKPLLRSLIGGSLYGDFQ